MAYRTVMSVDMDCHKCKRVALQSITRIDGIDRISINMRERTITVDGDADPVCIANQIRSKFRCARVVSFGPPPPPPKPEEPKKEKKDDGKKDGKKDDGKEDGKKVEEKKDDVKKEDVKSQIIICPGYPPSVRHCSCAPRHCGCSSKSGRMAWPGYYPPQPPANEVWYISNEENQGYCTIC